MVHIEQVRLLEERVQKVIARIGELQTENRELREQAGVDQEKIAELEGRIESFSTNQEEIERGILNALHQLDEVEDAVMAAGESRTVPTVDEKPAETASADGEDRTAEADITIEPTPAEDERPEASGRAAEEEVPPPADDTVSTESESVTAATADVPPTEETEGDEEPGPELDIF